MPDESHTLTVTIPFSECEDCGAPLELRVWGEGIDSDVRCLGYNCENKVVYR